MKKRAMLLFVFIMLATLFLASCDPRGDLSSAETEELYAEIKELFTTGEIFNYQVKPDSEVTTMNKPVKESDIVFIKSLSEQIFDESNQLSRYGMWWNRKRDYRICNILCSLPMQYDGKSCIVEEFSALKYKDGAVTAIIYYRINKADENARQRVWVRFEPNN